MLQKYAHNTECTLLKQTVYMGRGGVALGRILFVLPKIVSKSELSLMRLLRAKIWKNLSVDRKDQRRRSVWVEQADFSKIAQRKQKFIKHVNCVFT